MLHVDMYLFIKWTFLYFCCSWVDFVNTSNTWRAKLKTKHCKVEWRTVRTLHGCQFYCETTAWLFKTVRTREEKYLIVFRNLVVCSKSKKRHLRKREQVIIMTKMALKTTGASWQSKILVFMEEGKKYKMDKCTRVCTTYQTRK